MSQSKLVGQDYVTPDLVAKVTGRAKFADDYRADGMLFAKLLVSPLPHARVTRIDTSAATAMPGVRAIVTADDLPKPSSGVSNPRSQVRSRRAQQACLDDGADVEGDPILAVAAVDELTAAEAIEKIVVDYEPLPFVIDPLDSLRPGGRTLGRTGMCGRASPAARAKPCRLRR